MHFFNNDVIILISLKGVVADSLINRRWFKLLTVRRLMNTIGLVGTFAFFP